MRETERERKRRRERERERKREKEREKERERKREVCIWIMPVSLSVIGVAGLFYIYCTGGLALPVCQTDQGNGIYVHKDLCV